MMAHQRSVLSLALPLLHCMFLDDVVVYTQTIHETGMLTEGSSIKPVSEFNQWCLKGE